MCDYDDWEDIERSHEAKRLIDRVILSGQDALDDYIERYLSGKPGRDLLKAMLISQHAAWKLCRQRERFAQGCPAIRCGAEDEWCHSCYVAGQIAFTSGILGALVQEGLGPDGQDPEPEVKF